MGSFVGYRCSICKKDYAPEEVTYTCPADGGNLDVILDYQAIKSKIQPNPRCGAICLCYRWRIQAGLAPHCTLPVGLLFTSPIVWPGNWV
jgi:hypothetical protein